MTVDDVADSILQQDNPIGDAVKSLITVQDRKKGEPTEIELKTDLTADEHIIHSVLTTLNGAIEDQKTFESRCILGDFINTRERKALSKERKSRQEIVEIARQPEMSNMFGESVAKEGFIRRFFTGKKDKGV